MANAKTQVTKGLRGLEDRGAPSKVAGSRHGQEDVKVPSVVASRKEYEHTLQSAKSGLIVQLTAPSDRYNELSGVRVKARPLVLSFATHGGFIKLDLRNAEDRRRWLYVVGSDAAEAEFAKLGQPTARDPQDGTDPIAPHPRYGLGKSFWKLSDIQRETTARRRESLLKQIAADPEMAALIINSPDELARHLDKIKGEQEVRNAKVRGPKPGPAPSDLAVDGDSETV